MRFAERGNRPIFVYSEDPEELHALKNYGRFCEKAIGIKESKDNCSFVGKLEKIVYLLGFSLSSRIWERCEKVYEKLADGRLKKPDKVLVDTLVCGLRLLRRHEDTLALVWGRGTTSELKRTSPQATIRTAGFLQSPPSRIEIDTTETSIVEATSRIVTEFRRHKQQNTEAAAPLLSGEEAGVAERATGKRPSPAANTTITMISFKVSSRIRELCAGKVKVPREHAGFCRFEFPTQDCPEISANFRLGGNKIRVEESSSGNLTGEFLLGDVSSIVLNDPLASDSRKWLRINGRRIKTPDSFGMSLSFGNNTARRRTQRKIGRTGDLHRSGKPIPCPQRRQLSHAKDAARGQDLPRANPQTGRDD